MDDTTPPNQATNVPEYSVSEISGAVKRALEGQFGRIRVRGEISECKRYPSGHIYFSLKDEGGKIAGVVWKFSVPRLGLVPENGIEIIATGKISSYGERSSYQLIVERMEYAGAGALLARIETLKARLQAEGLFDADRRQPLPMLPRVIGVVTSESGAVIHDIKTTIARRFPLTLLIWPVPVQGEGAAARIAAAIAGFDAILPGGAVPRPDLVIVARGGGSLEDLMAFNEEIVVRAVAACAIPLISAVGHETDTTLIDFVSDRRAPTPTAAAEMAIPARVDLLADIQQKTARLTGGLNRQLGERRLSLERAASRLPDLFSIVGNARQRLDDRSGRLRLAPAALLASRRTRLVAAERHLPDLPGLLVRARQDVADRGLRLRLSLPNLVAIRHAALGLAGARLAGGLRHAVAASQNRAARTMVRLTDAPIRASLREAHARLTGSAARLEAGNPLALLSRGYALVQDKSGHPITSAASVKPGAALRIRFADGEVAARVEGRQASLPL